MGTSVKTFSGTAGRNMVDPTGDMRPSMLARLEYGLSPLERAAESPRRRLQREPRCECGHAASTHYDHLGHGACPCEGYMPWQPERCTCKHLLAEHRVSTGSCWRCECSDYTFKEDLT